MMSDTDRQGLEAIRSLHQQLDDDANGNIDLSETGDVSTEIEIISVNTDIKISFGSIWDPRNNCLKFKSLASVWLS